MNTLVKLVAAEQRSFTEPEARKLLASYGLPMQEYKVVTSTREAAAVAAELGFPVAMKIVSPDIIHKTDAGGVKLGISTPEAACAAFSQIVSNARLYKADADIHGVLITPMAKTGLEIIIGAVRDAQFGPVVMFGLGGVLVEIFKDVSFRVAPLTRADAEEMVTEIKSVSLLNGYRGSAPKDVEAIVQALLTLSRVMEEIPEIREIDLNPVFAYEKGILAVDARVII